MEAAAAAGAGAAAEKAVEALEVPAGGRPASASASTAGGKRGRKKLLSVICQVLCLKYSRHPALVYGASTPRPHSMVPIWHGGTCLNKPQISCSCWRRHAHTCQLPKQVFTLKGKHSPLRASLPTCCAGAKLWSRTGVRRAGVRPAGCACHQECPWHHPLFFGGGGLCMVFACPSAARAPSL